MDKLVNSTECAKILTDKLNRSVKRSFISKLATEGKIPFKTVKGRKMYDVDEVKKHLPSSRFTSYKSRDEDLTQLDIINKVSDNCDINFSIGCLHLWEDYDKDNLLSSLPTPMVTIEDVKEYLNTHVDDELIKKYIEDVNLHKFYALNEFLIDIRFATKKHGAQFNKKQLLFLFRIMMESFSSASDIAEFIEDEFELHQPYKKLIDNNDEIYNTLNDKILKEEGITLDEYKLKIRQSNFY